MAEENTNITAQEQGGAAEKTFTQAEVDALIARRVTRAVKGMPDEEELKPRTEYDPRRESYISFPRGDEVSSRHGDMQTGRGETKSAPIMTKDLAEKWVKSMQNSDGITGEHWTLEQIKNLIKQRNLDLDPVKLWAAMNAEYSDRYAVNRKHGVDSLDFYLDSAIAFWLKDKDAVADKEAAYYTFVAK